VKRKLSWKFSTHLTALSLGTYSHQLKIERALEKVLKKKTIELDGEVKVINKIFAGGIPNKVTKSWIIRRTIFVLFSIR
jgi:hypothetical protein